MQTNINQILNFVLAITFVLALLTAVIVSLLYFHQKRRITFQQQLAAVQLETQEDTLQHISREIHDNISLSLTLAKLQLNTLDAVSESKRNKMLESSVELISQAISDLSQISKGLNSEAIKAEGFLNALQMSLESLKKIGKYSIGIYITGEPVFMESQSELIAYRITQEALSNIIKHSKATKIDISLSYSFQYLILKIQDNGIGIDSAELEKKTTNRMSAGLNNMQKRAKMINGSCEIKSENTGTTVLVTIPLQTNDKSITN